MNTQYVYYCMILLYIIGTKDWSWSKYFSSEKSEIWTHPEDVKKYAKMESASRPKLKQLLETYDSEWSFPCPEGNFTGSYCWNIGGIGMSIKLVFHKQL